MLLKKIGISTLIVFSLLIALLYFYDYDYILKGVRVVYLTGHKTAFIDDTPYFDTHIIDKDVSEKWKLHKNYNEVPTSKKIDSTHQTLGTVAYLIIKNDSIFHEYYAEGYNKESSTNSFSMAKSVISALLFKAISEGYIKDLNTPVNNFIPNIEGAYASKLTVGDLSSMASGLNW